MGDNSAHPSDENESEDEQERPLQLVEVFSSEESDTSQNPFLKINENSLNTLLKSTKGRPISVIAITGSPRCGKSILLNFIKRDLEAKESGRKNTTEILPEFSWNTQISDKCTSGIWAWSRAFLIEKDDKSIAVILMDTEGLSDSMASSAIFGLSFLTSSILIYVANPDDTDLFSPFSTYFKYGLCCLEKDEELSEEQPPFQRLNFIFQNWNQPEKYSFGRCGGKSLINDKLATLRGRMKMETREGLGCFEQVAAYLFPPMLNNNSSTFPGCLDEFDDEFMKQLDAFISNLVTEENIPAKQIFGVQLSEVDFSNFFTQFVKMFNDFKESGEETISEDLIIETTCATFHTNIVNKAVEKYHDIFKKQSKGLKIQYHDDLPTIHEACVKHANLHFKQAKKLPGYSQKYEEKLKEELEQILKKKLEETFKCRKDFVDNCFKKAAEKFQTSLLNVTDFCSKELDKLKEEITREFLGNFLGEDDEHIFEMTDSLQTAFADTFEAFIKQKSISEKELVEEPMREMKQKLIQQYKTRMAEVLENTPSCESATLHKFHTHILNTIMETFTQAAVNNFDTAMQPGIEDSSQRLYDEMIENISAILEEFEEAHKYIEVETNAYSNAIMQANGDQDSLTFHQNEVSSILGKFEESCQFPVDSKEREYFKLKLETSLEEVYYSNKAKNWIHEGLKEYQQQMKTSATSCQTSIDFQNAHEKIKKSILDSFRKTLQNNCSEYFCREQEKQLVLELESAFEEMEDIFKMKMNADQVSAEELKEETRKFYHDAMRKHIKPRTYMDPVDLQDLHKTTVEAAIQQSKAKPALKKMLEKWLQSSFEKYKDENDMVLNYEDGVEPAIGTDLGTTYCCVAVLINGRVEIVRNLQGQNTTPSYVRIVKQSNEQVVGFVAKESSHRYAENTIFDAKRMIGRRFEDEKLQNDMNYWPFSVVQGEEGPTIEVFGYQYPPEQIASFLLRQLVTDAEKFLGKTVTKVVITVPAYFTDGQRQATIDAGEMAGLQVLTILNEPTAASIAYKMERFHEDARNVLIFDLGGGTFDVAILKTDAGSIEILAVDGDTHLGGEDFDKAMMQYCAEKFQNEHKLNPFKGKDSSLKVERDKAKQRLRRLQTYCEKRKIDLSFARSTTISVDTFQDATDLEVTISRETFEELVAPYFTKALQIVERVLKAAKLLKESIEDVVLVGGSTRIPRIQEMLTQFFNGKALNHTINPDEAVAYGAAVKAALMNGNQTKKMFNFKTIQDVTPMSLGVEAFVHGVAGHFSAIIPKSSKIPTVVKQKYSTLLDNQDSVLIKIYQGEAPLAKDNEFLGEFILKGIPPAAAGKEMVEVSMHINDMGILHVRAICKSSRGSEILTVFENKGRLSQGTKVRLLKEAQANDPAVLRRSYRRFLSEKGTENHGGFYKPKTLRKSLR